MKIKILYAAVFAFILTSLLTSCAFLQKEGFADRKYYNFRLEKHSLQGVKTEQASAPFQKRVTEKISAKEETLFSEKTATASISKKQVDAPYKENKPYYSEKEKSVIENKIKNEAPVVSLKRTDILKIAQNKTAHPASNSDAMLIVELFLAIILPPLGVLIHSGKVKKWFWITLLLCIAGGAFFGMTRTGVAVLCWGISALIALCYVLGMMKD